MPRQIYDLNQNAFESDTAEARYWLGFILADGYVAPTRSGGWCIEVSLAEQDAGHLEKLRLFLKSNHPIKTHARHGDGGAFPNASARARLAIYSTPLARSLVARGCWPGKTSRAQVPIGMAEDVDFWRGVVDGDGHVSSSVVAARGNKRAHRTYAIGVVGTHEVCAGFLSFAEFKVGRPAQNVKVIDHGNFSSARIAGQRAVRLMQAFYSDDVVALDRKSQAAKAIIAMAGVA